MIALVTLYYQLQDPVYRNGVYARVAWYVLGVLYFALVGRHKLVLSPEEEFAITGGQHGHPEREGYGTTQGVTAMLDTEPRRSARRSPTPRRSSSSAISSHVKVGVFDIDGIMRGKYMSRAKFLSALESGYGFCDVVLGWDCQDQLYDNVQFTGWHTGYPDAPVRILPESCRPLPFEDDSLFFLSEFARAGRAGLSARHCCAACSSARAAWASRRTPASSTKFFFFNETPRVGPREGLSQPASRWRRAGSATR